MEQQIAAADKRNLDSDESFAGQLVAVSGIDRDQFQALQQRA
jgi:hypothetical protein